jgi:hypothetical protein
MTWSNTDASTWRLTDGDSEIAMSGSGYLVIINGAPLRHRAVARMSIDAAQAAAEAMLAER